MLFWVITMRSKNQKLSNKNPSTRQESLLFEWLVKESKRLLKTIQSTAVVHDGLSQLEGKTLLLKTTYTLDS